jgi:hypothetical protein
MGRPPGGGPGGTDLRTAFLRPRTTGPPVRCSSCLLRCPWGKPRSPDGRAPPLWAHPRRRIRCARSWRSAVALGPPERALPHPEWGSRIHRDNQLILVITVVEAGDRAPSRCSAPRIGMLANCGWSAFSCCRHVDISTAVHRRRRPSTRCPLRLPWLSPAIPRPPPAGIVRTVGQRPRNGRKPRSGAVWMAMQRIAPGPAPERDRSAAVTSSDPAATRSPQAVHIPGDNFSMCRPRSPSEGAWSPACVPRSAVPAAVHGCGQTPG